MQVVDKSLNTPGLGPVAITKCHSLGWFFNTGKLSFEAGSLKSDFSLSQVLVCLSPRMLVSPSSILTQQQDLDFSYKGADPTHASLPL